MRTLLILTVSIALEVPVSRVTPPVYNPDPMMEEFDVLFVYSLDIALSLSHKV